MNTIFHKLKVRFLRVCVCVYIYIYIYICETEEKHKTCDNCCSDKDLNPETSQ